MAETASASEYQIAERDAAGRVTKVTWEGQIYDICVEDAQDSCINPRDAGLDFGPRDLEYWPGRPASQIDQPLPYSPSPALVAEQTQSEGESDIDGAFTDLNEPAAR